MKIGIAISTLNRPEVLRYTLKQFNKFWDGRIADWLVVDDGSTKSNREQVEKICDEAGWDFVANLRNRGVARTKNRCICELKDTGCAHVILFDDDVFPVTNNWLDPFIRAYQKGGQHHLCFAHPDHTKKIRTEKDYEVWTGILGVILFLSKEAIEKVGGFDQDFGKWGYEHHELTNRCFRAGLIANRNTTPLNIDKVFWSLDAQGAPPDFPWNGVSSIPECLKPKLIIRNKSLIDKKQREKLKFKPFDKWML